jgi:ubiquinone/menaquinone biosynthesis C-methylase UbiE
MKLENKAFWEIDNVIASQDKEITVASDFETYMFEQAKVRQEGIRNIEIIKIFGCGTGREINEAVKYYSPKKIIASDISENMIAKCDYNLKLWDIEEITKTLIGNAKDINVEENSFDLVIIFNSMMTYVPKKEDRKAIFKKTFSMLKANGVFIGTVHNQVGTPGKTIYFKLRNLLSFILGDKVGNRNTGFDGFKVEGYYYDKKRLIQDIKDVGYENIEVMSLQEFYVSKGLTYNRKKGYNNLIFIASKP